MGGEQEWMRRPARDGERICCVDRWPMPIFPLPRRTAAGAGTMSATDEAAEPRSLSVPAVPIAEPGRRIRRGWLVRRALLAADTIGLLCAFLLTEVLFVHDGFVGGIGIGVESAIFVGLLPVWFLGAKLYGLYDRAEERATHSTADDVTSG